MTLALLSFLPLGAGVMSEEKLIEVAGQVRALAPIGSVVEVRALDRTLVEMSFPEGSDTPEIILDASRLPPPIGSAVVVLSFDDNLDGGYARAWQTAQALHERFNATATGLFDKRLHCDQVREGAGPQVLAMGMTRRHRDLDRDQYMHYYLAQHVPLANELKPPLVLRYRTFRNLQAIGDFQFDCVTFQEFASQQTLEEFFGARLADGDNARDDAAEFIDRLVYNVGQGNWY